MSERDLRARVGIDDGDAWPAYAWPGGYPLVYVCDDGETLCAACMNRESESVHYDGSADGWRVDAVDVYYEGPSLQCAHCGATIDSAYGDPWADDDGESDR